MLSETVYFSAIISAGPDWPDTSFCSDSLSQLSHNIPASEGGRQLYTFKEIKEDKISKN